jgi:hypothetical protein
VRADERSVRKSFSLLRRHPVHRRRCGIIRGVPVLLIAGIALVVFGAFVLLKFPDRPGGEIAWHGITVKSVGGGLPLVVLGVAAIAIASFRGPGTPTGSGGPGESIGNSDPTTRTSDKRTLVNFDTLRVQLDGNFYELRFGGGAEIRLNFIRVNP